MYREQKYIITDKGGFAIFSKNSTHIAVAKGLYGEPVGAGFCNFAVGYFTNKNGAENTNINIHCYGESLSLHIKSRPEDEELINREINYHG